MKKRLIFTVLCLVLALSLCALAACENQGGQGSSGSQTSSSGEGQTCTHSYGDWATTTEPTCTKTGEKSRSCILCGNTQTQQIAKTDHSYGDWATTTEPSCTKDGEKSRSCTLCGNTQTQQIAKTPHSYENYVCTSCGDEITPSEGLAFTLNDDGESYSVSGIGTCTDTEIVIPETYNSKPVTSIGENAFFGCGLKSITIPDSVTSIDDWAFVGCSGLTSVTIPNSVTSIGEDAFRGCSKLNNVTIGTGVTSIGDSSFVSCSKLTSITIPDKVNYIGCGAFGWCDKLEFITVASENVKYHSNNNCIIETANKTLIRGCNNSIIPSDGSVTSIGDYAFSGCSGLTSVTIPDSVTSIGNWAFYGCSGLESITVASGNTKYHSSGNCLIETTTKKLIAGCKNSVIPADGSVTSIGWNAFEGCIGLISVTIPDSVTSIGHDAFYGCSGLTSITIPDSVTFIGVWAFGDCSGLTSITIPDSVTSIGDGAFLGCSGLESITVASENTKYHSNDNCLIETATKKLIAGCKNSVIPADGSVTSIGDWAFADCSGLTSVTIPNGITSIGSYAFWGCSGLTSITIGNSVTHIGYRAFEDCSGLNEIKFSGTVAEWNAITKDSGWNYNVPATQVICSDGTVDL